MREIAQEHRAPNWHRKWLCWVVFNRRWIKWACIKVGQGMIFSMSGPNHFFIPLGCFAAICSLGQEGGVAPYCHPRKFIQWSDLTCACGTGVSISARKWRDGCIYVVILYSVLSGYLAFLWPQAHVPMLSQSLL